MAEIELADHGFGQGVAVTPIQLAAAYAAIANGGVVMRPYVVQGRLRCGRQRRFCTHTPQALRPRDFTRTSRIQMNLLLRNVVNGHDGTGRLAQVADFTVAGKTGTAQMVNPATGAYYQNRLVASFVGFLPADDPRLVILVVLYDVGARAFRRTDRGAGFQRNRVRARCGDLNVAPANPTLRNREHASVARSRRDRAGGDSHADGAYRWRPVPSDDASGARRRLRRARLRIFAA